MKNPKKKWINRNIMSFSFASLFSDMSHEMVTALLPTFLSVQFGTAAVILGVIEGVSDLSSSFVKTFAGWLSDKLGKRKPFITLGYILTGIFIPIIGFTTSWVQVLFARSIGWMGRGIRGPPRDALLSDSVEEKDRSKAFGFERMMDTIGAIIGPGLAFLFLPLMGIRNIFFLSLVPGIAAALVIIIWTKEKPRKQNKNLKIMTTIKGLPLSFKRFLVAAGIFGIANFANTFLVLRVTDTLKASHGILVAGSIGTGLYLFLNVGAAIFAYVFGSLGDKVSKKYLLALGYFIFAIYCIGFIFLAPTILNFVFLFLLAGVETGLIDVMERAYAADLVDSKVRGTGFGVLNTVNGIGDFVSSVTAGILWTSFSFAFAFGYGASLAVIAAGVLVLNKSR